MSRQAGGEGTVVFAVALAIVGGAIAASFLDHAPWFVPWILIAIIAGRVAAAITRRRLGLVSRRVVVLVATAGVVIAGVVWIGFGRELNRDTRVQLRARSAAAVAAYERQHAHHARHQARRSRHHHRVGRRHVLTRRHAHPTPPSAAARFYGVGQLGRWHWQRIIAGWSPVLGAPLVLWGIAAGMFMTRRRRRRAGPPSSPTPALGQHGQDSLRTAGRPR